MGLKYIIQTSAQPVVMHGAVAQEWQSPTREHSVILAV